MSNPYSSLSPQLPIAPKKIAELTCIDKTRNSVHDASAAIINADMTLFDGCRIMISSNCQEAFILHNNKILGLITREDLFKAAFLDIEAIHSTMQDIPKNHERILTFQSSLHTEIRSHLNAIHAGLETIQARPEDLAMIHAIKLSTSSISDTLLTFEQAQEEVESTIDSLESVAMSAFLAKIITSSQKQATERGVTLSFSPRVDYKLMIHRTTLTQALRAILDDIIRSFGEGTAIHIESSYHARRSGEAHISIRVEQGLHIHSFSIDRASVLMSGLAHALVREAVRLHSGKLALNTDSDSSTVYEMCIPGAEPIQPPSELVSPITILIVEDDDEVLSLLRDIVSSRGYQVILASDGETALKSFFEHKPTLVLADVRIPKLDGIQLADKIKAARPNIPVILFSGQFPALFEEFQEKRIKADHVLYKPFATNDILESLTLLLPG